MKSIEWLGDKVRFLDQTQLPLTEVYIETSDVRILAEAIISLKVRGAPLIGISAAYGVLLGVHQYKSSSEKEFLSAFDTTLNLLVRTRPTAKNLFWALERMKSVVRLTSEHDATVLFENLEAEAKAIHEEDRVMCNSIGQYGASLVPDGAKILTHCNAGALATGGIGTALGVITTAHALGKEIHVYVDETRPLLQGARLTMWELKNAGVPSTLITDNSAAWTIKSKKIDLIIVGADRIVSNGDTANKIGTYNLAVLAKEHKIPFYIAAPTSTFDTSLNHGDEIIIEERSADEVIRGFGKQTAPQNVKVFAAAFDVTPNNFITAIITEKRILRPPFEISIKRAVGV
ncbi:MAG: S-methyl-5-thioribose-1-phosphate isomerase [Bacteroidota bacterium]|nr:S-methyl-5-thioribose-1-phosphate isomerase [Bacteroidota bacterium]